MGSEEFNGEECIKSDYEFRRKDFEGNHYCSMGEMGKPINCKCFEKGNICHAHPTKKKIKIDKKYNKFIGQIGIEGPFEEFEEEENFLDEERY